MPTTDRAVLTTEAYADARNLAARQAIYRWQRPHHDLPGQVVVAVADRSGKLVDVGCGNGAYLSRLRTLRPDLSCLGADLSAGMAPDIVADVQALPFDDRSVDVVLAMHMLYHLPRPSVGIAELARVLRPDGLAVFSTNGRADKAELAALWTESLTRVGVVPPPFSGGTAGFDLEDAGLLASHFTSVEVRDLRAVTAVPDVAPMVAYVDSCRATYEPMLPAGVAWADYLTKATAVIAERVAAEGAFVLTGHTGLILCRHPT